MPEVDVIRILSAAWRSYLDVVLEGDRAIEYNIDLQLRGGMMSVIGTLEWTLLMR